MEKHQFSEMFYESIVRNLQEGILVFAMNGHLTGLNPAASQMLGIPSQMIGKTMAEIFLGGGSESAISEEEEKEADLESASKENLFECVLEAVYEKGTVQNKSIEYRICRETRLFSVTTSYIQYEGEEGAEDSRPTRAVTVVIQDMTELYELRDAYQAMEKIRQINVELEEARKEAELANEAKSRFLSNMSHEIRTPLNAVLGMNEMILRACEAGEGWDEIGEYASNIKSAGNTLLYLINDILDLSKLESGKMELVPTDYRPGGMLRDLWNVISFRAEKKNLKLDFQIDETTPGRLHGDDIRIKQIVTNILTNAVKYTEKGEVVLSLNYKKRSEDSLVLVFRVKDTGMGIKKEDMPKLFEDFRRIEETKNRSIEGTGLGMSITLSLLKLMDGHLSVDSEYGKGSVFTVEIPQKIADPAPMGAFSMQEKSQSSRQVAYAPQAKVLVVDDNAMNRSVVRGLLKRTGVRLSLAASGKECLELARSEDFDLVFLDHMMPDMDGIETLARLRKIEGLDGLPVIALTANAVAGAEKMYLEKGFTGFLTKPIDPAALEQTLIEYLPKDKLSQPPEPSKEPEPNESAPSSGLAHQPAGEAGLVSVQEGLSYVRNDEEAYLELLRMFVKAQPEKKELFASFIEKEDMENYRIEVHGLKSNAGMLGAGKLSKMCKDHEDQSREGNLRYVQEHKDELFTLWDQTVLEIKNRFDLKEEEDTEAPPQGKAYKVKELAEAVSRAIEDLEAFRTEEALENIKDLASIGSEEGWRRQFKEAAYAVENDYDDEKAISILKGLL